MLHGILVLLASQLAGETLTHALRLPVPGPVLGMAMLAAVLLARPSLQAVVSPIALALLANLSLLFVPAAVGIVQVLPLLAAEGLAIGAALLVSTAACPASPRCW